MKLKELVQFIFSSLILLISFQVYAADKSQSFTIEAKGEMVTAVKPDQFSFESVQEALQNFTFDWNNAATLGENQKHVRDIETYLSKLTDDSKLDAPSRAALGKLSYALGTYYSHIMRDPDAALENYKRAEHLLSSKEEQAWNYAQMGYAYEQKYAATNQLEDEQKALDNIQKVTTQLYPNVKNQQVAFADCILGLVQRDNQFYDQAELNIKNALTVYETIPGGKGDQYQRAKNRLASVILKEGRGHEALTMLKEVKSYWVTQGKMIQDPYAARALLALAQAYLTVGEAQSACTEVKAAIAMMQRVYGNNSNLLEEPYQLLSDSYKAMGNAKQASLYKAMADSMRTA